MSLWADERTGLMLQIKDIFHQNEHRKHLIQLCIMRAQYLSQVSVDKRENGVIEGHETLGKGVLQNSSVTPGDADTLQRKVHGFELQVASLKMQLSTKEQAHAAKVDELREIIERLRNEDASKKISSKSAGVSHVSKKRPTLKPAGSPVSRLNKPTSLFFTNSPFSDLKSGRGNSFSGVEITSVASQASLKLSHAPPKSADDIFSPNNSSAESTPQKAKRKTKEKTRVNGTGPEKLGVLKEPESERSAAEILSTSVNMTVSDPEETFQSANATFDGEKEKKTKRKKIRLVSSEASKLLLALRDRGLDGEGEDLNSFKYYQDDNFDKSVHSPVPAPIRPVAAEPVAKKKHVFKIG